MNARGSLATASLIVCAMCGCAAQGGEEGPPEEAPADDEPLDITVDSLDIVHGALRVSATMVDGSADVSVRLGGDCEHGEVGGGLSTLSTLVWALGGNDVAKAIGCGLVVRARVRDGVRYVNKFAELAVTVDVAAEASENAEEGPQLQTVTTSETGVSVVFAPVPRSARLTTGDSILEATPPESDEDPAAGDDTGRFTVPRSDFARSVLRGRALVLEGLSFETSLSVGGTSIQGEPEGPDEPEEEPEEAQEEQDDEG
ncbi:MAG: hypothetical protein ACLP1X_19120 [Polyangiaceae bacterium]|jgi:hypothetical protein